MPRISSAKAEPIEEEVDVDGDRGRSSTPVKIEPGVRAKKRRLDASPACSSTTAGSRLDQFDMMEALDDDMNPEDMFDLLSSAVKDEEEEEDDDENRDTASSSGSVGQHAEKDEEVHIWLLGVRSQVQP